MAALRFLILVVLLLGFVVLAAPLQWLARRNGWAIARAIPILFSRSLCFALQVRPRFHGSQSTLRPQLLVCNHVSFVDILVLGCVEPQGFLAKREVASWPVFGWLARLQGTVFVDRTRRRSIPGANRQMADAMAAGTPVVLFAEGTTSDGTRTKRFLSSHFAAARTILAERPVAESVIIQPVAIAYLRQNGLPLGRYGRANQAWYGTMDLMPHVWKLLRGGPVDCHVIFCPIVPFVRGTDRKLAAAAAHAMVREAVAGMISARAPDAKLPIESDPPAVSILLQTKAA